MTKAGPNSAVLSAVATEEEPPSERRLLAIRVRSVTSDYLKRRARPALFTAQKRAEFRLSPYYPPITLLPIT